MSRAEGYGHSQAWVGRSPSLNETVRARPWPVLGREGRQAHRGRLVLAWERNIYFTIISHAAALGIHAPSRHSRM